MKITRTDGSATIGTTEYSLPAASTTLTAQTDACALQVFINLANLATSDQFKIRIIEKVNGQTAAPVIEFVVSNAQSFVWVSPILYLGDGWNVTVTKLAGTDRAINWSLRKQVEGESVVLGTDVISAAAVSAAAATKIQGSLATATNVSAVQTAVLAVLPTALDGSGFIKAQVKGMDANTVTAAAVATNAIDADALATDAVTELQTGLATSSGLASAVSPLATSAGVTSAVSTLATASSLSTVNTNVGTAISGIAAVQADTDDIQSRLPAALQGGFMKAQAMGLETAALTAIATAILGAVVDGSRTVKGVLSRLNAFQVGKATGLKGTVATFFKQDGVTKSFESTQDPSLGTRTAASTVAGD
jgi:hypothetical protein